MKPPGLSCKHQITLSISQAFVHFVSRDRPRCSHGSESQFELVPTDDRKMFCALTHAIRRCYEDRSSRQVSYMALN
jgi:hypothetical protein